MKKLMIGLCVLLFSVVLAACDKEKEEDKYVPPVVEQSKISGYVYDKDNITDYEIVWSDEFDYEGLPDSQKWGYDTGDHGWGNNELQNYTNDANASVKDGILTIEAIKDQDGKW